MAEIHFYSDEEKQHEVYPALNPSGVYPGITVGIANDLAAYEKASNETAFIWRVSGAGDNIGNGIATLKKIKGKTICTTVEEKCTMEVRSTVITATITQATFRTAVSNTSGTYTFTYTSGTWKRNNLSVNMADMGIVITGIPQVNDQIIVHFIAESIGTVTIAKPTYLQSIVFNQFNKNGSNILQNYYINASGKVVSGTPSSSIHTYGIVWVPCLAGVTYTVYNSDENAIYTAACSTTAPTSSSTGLIVLEPETITNYLKRYTPTVNGFLCIVPVNTINSLCCHVTKNGEMDNVYQSYQEERINFDIEYTVKDGNNQALFPNGLLQVANYCDEIDYETGTAIKRIKRTGIANLDSIKSHSTWKYIYDRQYVYYYDFDEQSYTFNDLFTKNTSYTVGVYGTERYVNTSRALNVDLKIPTTIEYPLSFKSVIEDVHNNKINNLNWRNGLTEGSLRTVTAAQEDLEYNLGINAIAEGIGTKAIGQNSHAEGSYTIARGKEQHVEGCYNIEDIDENLAHIIGNGTNSQRSNLHTISRSGDAWFEGNVYVGSLSGINKDNGSKKLITRDEVPNIYSGASEPSSSLGNDGDLFVLIDS